LQILLKNVNVTSLRYWVTWTFRLWV